MKYSFMEMPNDIEEYLIQRIRISIIASGVSSVETSFILRYMVTMDRAIEIVDKLVVVIPKIMTRLKALALFESTFPDQDHCLHPMDDEMINAFFCRFVSHEVMMASTGHGRYQGILKPAEFKRETDMNVRLNLGVYWTELGRHVKASTHECLFTKSNEGTRRISMKPIYATGHLLF